LLLANLVIQTHTNGYLLKGELLACVQHARAICKSLAILIAGLGACTRARLEQAQNLNRKVQIKAVCAGAFATLGMRAMAKILARTLVPLNKYTIHVFEIHVRQIIVVFLPLVTAAAVKLRGHRSRRDNITSILESWGKVVDCSLSTGVLPIKVNSINILVNGPFFQS